ncbi:MAG: hypothetical protein AAFO69_15775, partial [Bacteroidota bacterium]
ISFLKGDETLQNAISKMRDPATWEHTDKKHSLINAFSLAYREHIGGTMGQLMTASGHLEEICFNASEFSYGLPFRFQTGKGSYFGNYHLRLSEEVKSAVHIADALASSSCFPLGFEPMVMPDDYLPHDSAAYKELKTKEKFADGVGILDGGIVDNQGIGSTIKAIERRKKPYDLILVGDVTSSRMEPWRPDQEDLGPSQSIKKIVSNVLKSITGNWLLITMLFVGLSMTVLGVLNIFRPYTFILSWLGGFLTLFSAAVYIFRIAVNKMSSVAVWFLKVYLKGLIPKFFLQNAKFIDELPVNLLKRMIEERATSGVAMVNEVFLNQIRRLNYDLFQSKETLANRRSAVLINMLTASKIHEADFADAGNDTISRPSHLITTCAEKASGMGTTLWFTPEEEDERIRDYLIACGRVTTCFELIRYLKSVDAATVNVSPGEFADIKARLISTWEGFVKAQSLDELLPTYHH